MLNLPESLSHKHYWYLRLNGVAWHMLFEEKIMPLVKDVPEKEQPVLHIQTPSGVVYLVSKKHVSVEELMKMTGASKDFLEGTELIDLEENVPEGLPAPNVSYWGRG